MTFAALVLVTAMAAAIGGTSALQDARNVADDCDFDFFVFSELSPGADCYFNETKNCSGEFPPWTMHGMWPSTLEDPHKPECCNNEYTFNQSEINYLIPQLKKYWPSLGSQISWDSQCYDVPDYMYLWCHEWITHGTCYQCPKMSTEHSFFSKVLELYKTRMDYDTFVLAKHNIEPSKTHPYKKSEFASAFEQEWGEDIHPVLLCDQYNSRQILTSIRTCLNKQFEPIRCPDKVYSERRCEDGEYIYYMPS